MINEMLPLGTVIKLKNGDNKLMIIGYFPETITKDEQNPYHYSQYIGVDYLDGLLENGKTYCFDDSYIENVYYMGFATQAQREWLKILKDLYKDLQNGLKIDESFEKMVNSYYSDPKERERILNNIYNIKSEDIK